MDHMISHSQDPKNLACARGFLLLGGCAGCVWRVASGECFEKRFLLSLSPPSVHLSAETHRGLAACVQSTFPWRGYTDQLNMAEETHPLQHEWVLWEHKSASGAKDPSKWKENMKQLCSFSTAEDFWKYFNHLPRPSEVFYDGDCRKKIGPEGKTVEEYSLFKKGIEPEWGDPQNVIGGEWYCRQYFELDVLDLYWQNLVMGVVGETIEDSVDEERTYENHINGARVVDKSRNFPMYRLEVWINTRDPTVKDRIRNRLVEVMTDGQTSKKTHPKFDWKDHT